MTKKYSDEELTGRLKTPGWKLVTGQDGVVHGTLEDVARSHHARRAKGEAPGLIAEAETAIELEMLQIEALWRALGLPV